MKDVHCQSCATDTSRDALRRNRWGDLVCPRCGSPRVAAKFNRMAYIRAFLVEWNTY